MAHETGQFCEGHRGEIPPVKTEQFTLDGIRYHVVYEARGDFMRTDGKGAVPGIGFLGVVPA
jgi:hypothetical protein